MKKYFPIQTETACKIKWSWSTIFLTDGISTSCHHASPGTLTEENFFNFHNLPNKIEDRKKMLQGKWPGNGCEFCRDVELQGGFSERQFQLTIPENYPSELDNDNSAVEVIPTTLEIFFENTCNLLCVYCSEKYSSSIQKENKKYGYIQPQNKRDILAENHYEKLAPKLWEWLSVNYTKLKRVHILGGEPLIQQDFFKFLQFINENPNPHLELSIVTNLAVKNRTVQNCFYKIESLIRQKKVRRVEVQVSIDGWGPGQEYVRSGLQLKTFEKNFNYLLEIPYIKLSILSTLTSLSIFEMPALTEKINNWKKIKKIDWYIHNVLPQGESVFDPKIFNYDIFANSLELVYNLLSNNNFDEQVTKNMIMGTINYLKDSTTNISKINLLIDTLNQIDSRRNYNWQTTFPWLKNVVQQNSI